MLQTMSWLLPELALFLMTAVATHLATSFAQTLMHYKLGHHPMGGKLFRNHINFHHTYYSKDHLVSRQRCGVDLRPARTRPDTGELRAASADPGRARSHAHENAAGTRGRPTYSAHSESSGELQHQADVGRGLPRCLTCGHPNRHSAVGDTGRFLGERLGGLFGIPRAPGVACCLPQVLSRPSRACCRISTNTSEHR